MQIKKSRLAESDFTNDEKVLLVQLLQIIIENIVQEVHHDKF